MYATTEGVVLAPSEFSITFAWLPSITATQELVVPKSIPITLDITFISFYPLNMAFLGKNKLNVGFYSLLQEQAL